MTRVLWNIWSTIKLIFWIQYVSEKIGGAKGTELDDEFIELERVIEQFKKLQCEMLDF